MVLHLTSLPHFTELGAQWEQLTQARTEETLMRIADRQTRHSSEKQFSRHMPICLLDGDADRLVAIASDGTTIDGDRQLCLFAKDLAQRAQLRHGNVVITEMSQP